jgi:cytochrome c biogenesis protein CcdA
MSITLLLLSLVAGVLTVLAPCVLPLLPIIIGGSAVSKNPYRPLIIVVSLAISIFLFTIFLRLTFGLLPISLSTWRSLSGGLVVALGLVYIFPEAWSWASAKLKFSQKSDEVLNRAGDRSDWVGAVLTGVALGPVFSSCSPTYAILLATVLPVNFGLGLIYILIYLVGLGLVLFLVGFWGQVLTQKLKWAANPTGWFRRGLGLVFVLVGVLIILGVDKQIEAWLVEQLPFAFTEIEQELLREST